MAVKFRLWFLQSFVFPKFKMFSETAAAVSTSSEPVVSCRGLQGNAAQAKETVIKMMLLILSNDIVVKESGRAGMQEDTWQTL